MGRLKYLLLVIILNTAARAQYLDFNKYGWQYFDTSNSEIPSNYVTDVYLDNDQSIWVSTTSEPLIHIFNGGRWEDVAKTGLAVNWWMNDWCQTGYGKYLIAGKSDYLLFFHFGYQQYDTIAIPNETPSVLETNEQGVVLVGCVGSPTHNLYQMGNNRKPESLNDRYGDVFAIWIENNGDALVAFKQGLYRFKQRSDGTYAPKGKQVSDKAFYDVVVDDNGVIWATCMEDGYLHSYDGDWHIYKGGPRDLYCNYQGETRYVANKLLLLDDGRILVSTLYNTGIAVFNGVYWKAYKPELKVQGDGINRMVLGPDGSIWCGTTKNGLAVFRPAILIKPRKKRVRRQLIPEESSDSLQALYEEPAKEGNGVPYIPDPVRKVKTHLSFTTFEDSVMVRVWDSQKIDGDTISLYCNGVARLKYQPLTAKQDTFYLSLTEGDNEILLYAHNLGSIPPNTATIVIVHGSKVLNVDLSSDLNTCERLLIRRRRKDGSSY